MFCAILFFSIIRINDQFISGNFELAKTDLKKAVSLEPDVMEFELGYKSCLESLKKKNFDER